MRIIRAFCFICLILIASACIAPPPAAPAVTPTLISPTIAPTNQPTNEPTNEPINQPTSQSTNQPTNMPLVKIQSGELQGVRENNLSVFKGIPYAAPPVGELRWREPQPVAAWNGVRSADAFGSACVQPTAPLADVGSVGPQDEDCLYLNVWTPNPNPDAKLPVMVWIHGGALVRGAGSAPLYDGAALAERGAVVVNFNYRLGPLGFFAHPALDKEQPNGPVNFGLLDEIAALKWVQQNIAAFGGDPNNVTIFGESAGAESVLALFASPLAQGLFQRGIAESPYGIPSHTRAKASEAGIVTASALGLNGADATLEELRAVPAENFAAVKEKGASLAPSFVYGDAALPEPILDIFQKGKQAALPLIIGSNSDEATVAILFGIDPAKLIEKLGIAKVAIKPLYPGVNDNNELGRQLIRDLIFTALVKRIADLHAQRAPSWRYYFSYLPEKLRGQEPGVPHGGEIVFVLDTSEVAPVYQPIFTDADRAMAKRVGDYWFAYAQTGKPEPAGEPAWAQSDAKNDVVMEFGETIALQQNFMKARLDVFVGLLNVLGKLLERE